MRQFIQLFIFSLFMCCMYSCKKNEPPTQDSIFHYNYYPIATNQFHIYDVTEINHDATAAITHDTLIYQLKVVVGDTIIDNAGRIANKLYRYKRNTPFDSWELTDLWTTIVINDRAEQVEENIRRVLLRFPVSANVTWDPNQFNFLNSGLSYYENIHKPFGINGIYTDSSVKVNSGKELTLISYTNQFEIYGKGIGLMQKFYKDLKIVNFDTLNVQSGNEMFFNLVEFGN